MNAPGLLDHLIAVLLPKGGYVAVIFNAYLDESYEDDCRPPIFVFGGYLLTSAQASQMEAKWKKILADAGVTHFHMKEVAPCKGDFEHLGMDGCDKLVRACMALVEEHCFFGEAAIVNAQRRWATVSPDLYADVVHSTVAFLCFKAKQYAESQNDPEPHVALFLDKGHNSRPIADALLKRDDFDVPTSYSFVDDKDVCLVQAADMLAWLTAAYAKQKINGRPEPRADYLALIKPPPIHHHSFLALVGGQAAFTQAYSSRTSVNDPIFHLFFVDDD